MDFLSPIISPIVETLMIPVKKHVDFWVSSTKYVKDMDAGMKRLKEKEKEVKDAWEMALANTEVVPESVEPWLKDVQEFLKERENSIPKGPIGCFNVLKRHKAGERSFNCLQEINELKTRGSKIEFTKEKLSLAMVRPTSTRSSTSALVPKVTQNNFRSRELIYNEALKSLDPTNNNLKMIALCGIGGIGKTTMMNQLEKDVKDSNMFNWVVKVRVGKNRNLISLQRAVAERISEDLAEEDQDARADRLGKKFDGMSNEGKKKVLVIMDDIWEKIDLKDVGLVNPLPNGFKLLLTSRFPKTCTIMGADPIFDVGFLSDTEAKDLFFESVGYVDDHKRKIGDAIVMRCGGFPIAIKTIAEKLRGAIKEEWELTLSRLKANDLKDLESITETIFQMSYENLKDGVDKAIFLLSGLFPNDSDIRTEDLLRYGWGLNFFKDFMTLEKARSQMKLSVSNLIRANLLIKSDVKGCVKMHDLVLAFVLSNFSIVKQALFDYMSGNGSTKGSTESYDRISLKCTGLSAFPTDFNHPNLSLLVLRDGYELRKFPEDMYRKMEKLEAVSFENVHIPLFPVAFEHSTKLRTLCLHSCVLEDDDLLFLGNLGNLETLSFAGCKLEKLPSAVGRLKKLKLRDVTECSNLCVDDDVFQNLESLEELYMVAYKRMPIRFTHANCDGFEKLSSRLSALELEFLENKAEPKKVSFEKLKRFRISIGCELKYSKEMILFENTLQFVADRTKILEYNFSNLLTEVWNLELQVDDIYRLEDIAMNQSFSNLRVLHVSNCADLTCLFTAAMANDLIELERLTVSSCPVLTSLVDDNSSVSEIKFQKLKFMSLKSLPNMVRLSENVLNLPEMVELTLVGLPNFTSIYPDLNNTCESEMKSLLDKKVMIPKLEKLTIYLMENLKQIWPCHVSTTDKNNVSMLRRIIVSNCGRLVNLFPSNSLSFLTHLEELRVTTCGFIEVLFNIDFNGVSGIGEDTTSKLRNIYVWNLPKLKELWKIRGVNNSDILASCFKNVESIHISMCKEFSNLFTPTNVAFDLGALKKYDTFKTGEEIISILEGEISEVDDYISNVTYPSYFLRTCHQLQQLQLTGDGRVEVVFDMDSQPSLLLPCLQDLRLEYLNEMSRVWKVSNWTRFLHQLPLQQFPFQNLKDIYLKQCPKIKYLFSPLMAIYLSSLKSVKIDDCDGIEEVVSCRDDENDESTTSHQTSTFFPHLDSLKLYRLPKLSSISIRHQFQRAQVIGAAYWSFCQYPRKIEIKYCDSLSSLIPWYAAGHMKRLEELEIARCDTMMEVFESELINNSSDIVDEGSSCGTTLTRSTLENITTVVAVPQLYNLKIVSISFCRLLSHLFTFSTLGSLKQLKKLTVEHCDAIQVIVTEENIGTPFEDVRFPRLETLTLDNLPELKGFFLGMNKLKWPLLENVTIRNCPQMTMFTRGPSEIPKLKYRITSFGKYIVEGYGLNVQETMNETALFPTSSSDSTISKGMPWSSFHNLIEINMDNTDVGRSSVIPSHALLQLHNLEKITIEKCDGVYEVFEVIVSEEGVRYKGFNELQTAVQVPNLREVKIGRLDDLKYLWKSNQWMVLEFSNLTTLSIDQCNRLEHVFTSSMVASLVQLQHLEISICYNIEVVVKEEEEEERDGTVNEIMLPHLKSISLSSLSSLKGFSLGKKAFSFPALDTLTIRYCPALMEFTNGHLATPKLKVIGTEIRDHNVKEDLNSFIKTNQRKTYVIQ